MCQRRNRARRFTAQWLRITEQRRNAGVGRSPPRRFFLHRTTSTSRGPGRSILGRAGPARARPGGGRYPPGDHAGKQDWTVCRPPGLVDYAKTWPPGHHVKERWWFRRPGGVPGLPRTARYLESAYSAGASLRSARNQGKSAVEAPGPGGLATGPCVSSSGPGGGGPGRSLRGRGNPERLVSAPGLFMPKLKPR